MNTVSLMNVAGKLEAKTEPGNGKIWLLGAFVMLLLALVIAGEVYGGDLFTNLKEHLVTLQDYQRTHPFLTIAGYSLLLYAIVALFLPLTMPVILASGALFDPWLAVLLTVAAATAGDFTAFLLARYHFRDTVRRLYSEKLEKLDRGMESNGWFYVILLKFIPIIPGPPINFGLGISNLSRRIYVAATVIGKTPLVILYVIMSEKLTEIEKPGDILTPDVLAIVTALTAVMIGSKWVIGSMRRRGVW